jgi:hypothetical protein
MVRQLTKISLAGASRRALVDAWESLGFSFDAARAAIDLADGVVLDFFADDDPEVLNLGQEDLRGFLARFAAGRGGAALIGLSGEPDAHLGTQPKFLGAAECFFQLAPKTGRVAPDHPNGAVGVKVVAAVAGDPADHAEFLSQVTGQREMRTTSAGLEIRLGGAVLDVLTPAAFAFRFGRGAADFSVFRLAGLVFAVENLEHTEESLRRNGVAVKREGGRLLAGPREGAGVFVAFEPR